MRLSVLICTRNRAHAISGCLNSVAAAFARAAPLEAEIVVVDNGSTDGTAAVLQAWAEASGLHVQLLTEPVAGLARSRNRALGAARGALLVFTDDDCRLERDYVRQLLAYDAADSGLVLRGGHVMLGDPTDLRLTFTRPVHLRWNCRTNPPRHDNLGHCVIGCNMTLRRALAERIGPFDTDLGAGTALPGGEDTDYVYRAYLLGATIEAVADMTVIHCHGRKTAADGYSLMRDYSVGSGAITVKYLCRSPMLCRQAAWDIRHALREITVGTNILMPEMGFSAKARVGYKLLGAALYIVMRATAFLRPAPVGSG